MHSLSGIATHQNFVVFGHLCVAMVWKPFPVWKERRSVIQLA